MRTVRDIIPNALSLSRIPLGMAFLLLYSTSEAWRFWSALAVAMLALLTDIADGRLARRWKVTSDAGALIDGLGDKAFYVAVYLVIAANHAAESLLLWALIFREVALYALRTIDGNRSQNTKQLRWASLAYAFVIRMYFLYFVLAGWFSVTQRPVPFPIGYGFLFGYVAAIFGYIGLVKLAQQITERSGLRG
ncbi:CDP-alcohol phosphatidyltransferase family protein [Sphingomonas sp. LB-2]|uniref:CDP-alcohol phosphatidyltransferase family protein n=1 Tax=Sphingomonas caeni TaxID=2984949 RepID=UPI00222EFDA0|nr:CDP-alcohol phosphatidyltransferase family protein [Sphingomonas caeni]MCW3848088.1 CDP-alcohol phosphatidyltransferase family protein [Sphingomonas caeni]